MAKEIYRTFDALSNSIATLGEKWKEAAEKSDKAQTYAGIQERMKTSRFFFDNERKEFNKKLDGMKTVYNPELIEKERGKLNNQLRETAAIMEKATRQEISALTLSRKEKVAEMLTTPPTEEQLRLLSVLQMRDDLSDTELHSILPTFFGNYQAMKVLQSVGKKNGVSLMLPPQLDPRSIFENIEKADEYLNRACTEISKPWRDVDLRFHAFYTVNDEDNETQYDPVYAEIIAALDTVPQLQDVKAEKTQLTPTEKARIDFYFKDVAGLDVADTTNNLKVLKRTKEVMTAHPEEIEALRLSEYAGFVSEIEEAQAAEKGSEEE